MAYRDLKEGASDFEIAEALDWGYPEPFGVMEMRARREPGERVRWYGEVESLDGCSTDLAVAGDIVRGRVAREVENESGWDGETAGLVLLRDGRWLAWEAGWGPTGDCFHRDAYGGDGTVYVARDRALLARMSLGDMGRRLLCIDVNGEEVSK